MSVSLYAWNPYDGNPPGTNYAVLASVNSIPFLSFAAGTTITTVFEGVIPQNAILASGLDVYLNWSSGAASPSGTVNWGAAYERLGVATVASDHFGTQVKQATTVGAQNVSVTTLITIPYANMNSSVPGDAFRLQIQRVTGTGDTMSGAAQLFAVHLYTP